MLRILLCLCLMALTFGCATNGAPAGRDTDKAGTVKEGGPVKIEAGGSTRIRGNVYSR